MVEEWDFVRVNLDLRMSQVDLVLAHGFRHMV